MSRRKVKDRDKLLAHPIIIRLTAAQYNKLEDIRQKSDHKTIGHVVRNILDHRPIKLLHKDISLNAPMEELAMIRKEIKSIGVNINQQTHKFHLSKNDTARYFHVHKTSQIYKEIEPKIDSLLLLVSKLAERWLQK